MFVIEFHFQLVANIVINEVLMDLWLLYSPCATKPLFPRFIKYRIFNYNIQWTLYRLMDKMQGTSINLGILIVFYLRIPVCSLLNFHSWLSSIHFILTETLKLTRDLFESKVKKTEKTLFGRHLPSWFAFKFLLSASI